MTSHDRRRRADRLTAGCVFASVATAVACGLVGYRPTAALAGPEGVPAMVAAIAAALPGSLLAVLVTGRALAGPPTGWIGAAMLGLGLRFGLTIAAVLLMDSLQRWPRAPLLLWIAIAQLVLLKVDTLMLVLAARRMHGSDGR
ncbi:MAG: hypothetical protein HRU75_05370 [Planctomycetia bacterium]|nr:MAG: hypothetical protein HRU75_05370 [Planctomycetia bacterium]